MLTFVLLVWVLIYGLINIPGILFGIESLREVFKKEDK